MRGFHVVQGRAYPFGRDNVDTDMIVSTEWLKTISRDGLGEAAFAALRNDPTNVFDDPRYAGAPILIAGENFGCGSSREHAAWAIAGFGIRAVIAISFSDIFARNAFRNGILTVALPRPAVQSLLSDAVRGDFTIDLDTQAVSSAGAAWPFEIDAFRRRCLIEGLDEIALTLEEAARIAAFEETIMVTAPWLTNVWQKLA